MNAKLIVEGKEFDIEILDPELQKLIAPARKTGYERVKDNKYYFINGAGSAVDGHVDVGDSYDNALFDAANYYSTMEIAENNARADKLMHQLRRFAVEHRNKKLKWSSDADIYGIYYNHSARMICTDCHCISQRLGAIYFDGEETAKLAIESFKDELTWYFTEYKDSL